MLFDSKQIKEFLPHRDPFVFVDSIESVTHPSGKPVTFDSIAGVKVVGSFRTDPDHMVFKGHFPGNPILPGVIQVEMMAQVCAFTVSTVNGGDIGGSPEVALLGVTKAKFRKPVLPNQTLRIETTCIKPRNAIMTFECKIFKDENVVSECSLIAHMPILKTQRFVASVEKELHP